MRLIAGLTLCCALAGCTGQSPIFNGGGLFPGRAEINNATPTPTSSAPTQLVPTGEPNATSSAAAPPSTVGAPDPFQTAVVNPDENGGPEANAPPSDGRIGTTIASLGDPAEGGFWVKTALVSAPTSGRVVYVNSGRSVQVQLIPLDGPAGGGSQISLAAMRLLDAPLTGLPELVVYTAS